MPRPSAPSRKHSEQSPYMHIPSPVNVTATLRLLTAKCGQVQPMKAGPFQSFQPSWSWRNHLPPSGTGVPWDSEQSAVDLQTYTDMLFRFRRAMMGVNDNRCA